MKKEWNEISYSEWNELKEKYLALEGYGSSEEKYIKGYMEDGLTEDEAFQVLTDNTHDYYYQNKIELDGAEMIELIEEYKAMAAEAKEHLELYPMSICEIRIEIENIELSRKIITEAVGDQLIKRIHFFPKAEV